MTEVDILGMGDKRLARSAQTAGERKGASNGPSLSGMMNLSSLIFLATSDAIWISFRTPCLSADFRFATRRTLRARFRKASSNLRCQLSPPVRRRTSAQTS